MQRIAASPDPAGFAFHYASDDRWLPHPVPGIRMKVLALNKARGYATLLLDVAPGHALSVAPSRRRRRVLRRVRQHLHLRPAPGPRRLRARRRRDRSWRALDRRRGAGDPDRPAGRASAAGHAGLSESPRPGHLFRCERRRTYCGSARPARRPGGGLRSGSADTCRAAGVRGASGGVCRLRGRGAQSGTRRDGPGSRGACG